MYENNISQKNIIQCVLLLMTVFSSVAYQEHNFIMKCLCNIQYVDNIIK